MKHRFLLYLMKQSFVLSGLSLVALLSLTACAPGEGADPGVQDFSIAYVKRTIPVDNNGDPEQADVREPLLFSEGGDLFLRESSAVTSAETNLTLSVTNGVGDVKDVETSFDGKKILFSLRLQDPDPNDDTVPSWNIYEYDRDNQQLRRIITSDLTAEEGDDIAPHYLPGNRIVFSSNRQKQAKAVLLDEDLGKEQFSSLDERRRVKALVLHVMNDDGTDIHQISFNQSHDLDPTVLSDGRILFSRWDNMGNRNAINLYTTSPDGSDIQLYYGGHGDSHDIEDDGVTVQFTQPHEMADGRIMSLMRPFTDTYGGGDIVILDGNNYIDEHQPIWSNQGVLSGPAQLKATSTNVINDGSISIAGRYSAAYPLWDVSTRILVSKGLCQLMYEPDPITGLVTDTELHPCIDPWLSDANIVEAPTAYGIWIYDMGNNTELPIVISEPGKIITDVVALLSRSEPPIIFDKGVGDIDAVWSSEGVGVLNIRSVYDFGNASFNGCFLDDCTNASVSSVQELGDPALATADQRPARFIRIVKAVGIPDPDDPDLANPPDVANTAFGPSRQLGMREIIGYAPVEPDGSVKVKVPFNVAFSLDVLDKDGRRIGPRHDNWLQVRPGDTLNCTGCHTHDNNQAAALLPHGRDDAMATSINSGAPYDGYIFPNTLNDITMGPYFADYSDTMAEARTRQVPAALTPTVNIVYDDAWTDPVVRPRDLSYSFDYTGVNGLTTLSPASGACEVSWTAYCRTVINYEEHIQPLWEEARAGGACISCHTSNSGTAIPAGQLDLTRTPADEEPDHVEGFRELLFEDDRQALDLTGSLIDLYIEVLVLDPVTGDPVLDANGDPVTQTVVDPNADPASYTPGDSETIDPSMSVNGARASYFIEKMLETELEAARTLPTPTVNHAGMLSNAEMRLITEWIEIGAQYYNNPFHPNVPVN